MKMIYLESVDSTHTYIKDYIATYGYQEATAVVTQNQTNGIGSRDNNWDGQSGNLFFSFIIDKEKLPYDLPVQSASIYFSYILKELLEKEGSTIWLKWPNDFYINDKKIGGTITNISSNLYYCGIGLNLKYIDDNYGNLDITIDVNSFLNKYFDTLLSKQTWKNIFSKYTLEFEYSKQYKTTIGNKKVSLKDATLNSDGSIIIDNKKVFSLR